MIAPLLRMGFILLTPAVIALPMLLAAHAAAPDTRSAARVTTAALPHGAAGHLRALPAATYASVDRGNTVR